MIKLYIVCIIVVAVIINNDNHFKEYKTENWLMVIFLALAPLTIIYYLTYKYLNND